MAIQYLYGAIALICWVLMFFQGQRGIVIGLGIGIAGLLFLILVGCLGWGCRDSNNIKEQEDEN